MFLTSNSDLAANIRCYLESFKFTVTITPALQTTLGRGRHSVADLVLIDSEFEEQSEPSLAGEIYYRSGMPVIVLTQGGTPEDGVIALETGADDFMAWPGSYRELLARIRAVLRRAYRPPTNRDTGKNRTREYWFEGWRLDLDMRRLYAPSGAYIVLTHSEHALLIALVEAKGRVITRSRLLDLVRGPNVDLYERSIDMLVLRLRRKLEPHCTDKSLIETVRGAGYRLRITHDDNLKSTFDRRRSIGKNK